ncbi:hypothetical protein D3C83_150300 [compost metagenome]
MGREPGPLGPATVLVLTGNASHRDCFTNTKVVFGHPLVSVVIESTDDFVPFQALGHALDVRVVRTIDWVFSARAGGEQQ